MYSTRLNLNSQDFSLSNLIPKCLIEYLCSDTARFRLFDPSSTLFCLLYQVINNCSMKAAILTLNFHRINQNKKLASMNTSALTKAKKRLDENKRIRSMNLRDIN